jgi:hypothetical protein
VLGPGDQPGDTTYHRVFRARETEEVRFYALGGNDVMALSGGKKGPRVRMVGGKGDDTFDANGAGNAKLSDSEGRDRALTAAHDKKPYQAPPPPENAPWIPPRDFTRETWGIPLVAYNADIGVFLGYAVQQQRYGFRKSPHASSHRLSGGWAFDQEGGRADYLGDFRRENRSSYFSLYGYASGIEVLRFYGFGNETEATEGQEFYRVHATQYLLYPALRVPFGGKWQLSVGPALKYTKNDEDKDELINTLNPYGAGRYGALAVHGILSWDGRDNAVLPQRRAGERAAWLPGAALHGRRLRVRQRRPAPAPVEDEDHRAGRAWLEGESSDTWHTGRGRRALVLLAAPRPDRPRPKLDGRAHCISPRFSWPCVHRVFSRWPTRRSCDRKGGKWGRSDSSRSRRVDPAASWWPLVTPPR